MQRAVEHREFAPVELPAERAALRNHGRDGGWITAVLNNDTSGMNVQLLGMRPVSKDEQTR